MAGQEGKFKKILGSKITLFLLLLAFIWLSVNLVNIFYKKYKVNQEIENLKAEIGKVEKSNQEISSLIDYFSSQSFLEKEAKEKLNLKKEGEQVVIIEPAKEPLATTSQPESVGSQASADQNSASLEKSESNFTRWWRYFFK